MIRIMVERHVKEGKKGDLLTLLRELRTVAMYYPGYVTGETLASAEDPSTIMVMSTWQSMDAWKEWEKSAARSKVYEKIEPLLAEKPRVTVYQVMATEK